MSPVGVEGYAETKSSRAKVALIEEPFHTGCSEKSRRGKTKSWYSLNTGCPPIPIYFQK